MRRLLKGLVSLALLVFSLSLPVSAQTIAKTSLKVGDVAPDFTLLSDKWETVKLSDYRGKENVILAFYVLAFTPG